jgi:hypothetical protein
VHHLCQLYLEPFMKGFLFLDTLKLPLQFSSDCGVMENLWSKIGARVSELIQKFCFLIYYRNVYPLFYRSSVEEM